MHMEVAEQDFDIVFKEITTRVALGASRKHMPLMIEMRSVLDLYGRYRRDSAGNLAMAC
jgi:hypothetical protein